MGELIVNFELFIDGLGIFGLGILPSLKLVKVKPDILLQYFITLDEFILQEYCLTAVAAWFGSPFRAVSILTDGPGGISPGVPGPLGFASDIARCSFNKWYHL
ncbi:unnamed protein product [Bathycoccus prasinos]